MRIALTYPHSLGAPGGGTHDCIQLARHLVRAGADLELISVRSLGPSRFPRPTLAVGTGAEVRGELEADGIRVHEVEPQPAHYLLDGRPVARAVRRIERERGLDAVLGWWNETLFLRRFLAQRGIVNAMNAAASYGPMFSGSGGAWPRRLRTEMFLARPLRHADVVFARSEFTRGELIALGQVDADRIRVAYLGVDSTLGEVDRVQVEGPPIVLFFGTLVPAKGLFDAIEALGMVKARDWTFQVAGWGDAEAVHRAVEAAGIGARVEVLGQLDRPQLRAALGRAQVALLPSHTESFGLANAEAQTAGLPVIACEVAAVPEVVLAGETGWLVPPRDPAALAVAIGAALDDPLEAARRGLAGRQRMLECFTWERTAATTIAGLQAARDGLT